VAFARWDPFRDLLALHEQIGQLVGEDAPGWAPPVDLYESDSAFILMAELPGLSRDEIDIQVEDRKVSIRGVRGAHRPDKGVRYEQFHLVERGHGRFSRTFTLPEAVEVERVTAELKEGVLTITLPKAVERVHHITAR
jgi:HSP20 family protein